MRPPRCGSPLPALLALAALAALAGPSPAPAATITWSNAAGGVWHTASNWTPQQVPDSTSDVVIALSGNYTVTLGAAASVKSVSLGGGSGTLTLTTSGSPTLAIAESSTVMPGGSVHFNGFVINGAGRLHVAANATLIVTGGIHPLPISNAGTLAAQGNPDLNGTFTSLAGSTLRMVAGSGGGSLDFAGGFVNRGTIEVTSSGCACFSEINVLSGTLVNEVGASISILAGAGGARSLDAQLDNRGTLTIGATTEIRRASSDHLNSGTLDVSGGNLTVIQETTTPSFVNTGAITVAAGRTFTVNHGAFQHAAGSITGAGTMSFTNAATFTLAAAFTPAVLSLAGATLALEAPLSTATTALSMSGGTLNGPATLTNGAAVTTSLTSATLNAPLVNKGTLNLFSTTNVNGSFQADPGSTLRVYGVSSGGPTTFAQAFTNFGALELTSTGCPCTATLNGVAIVNEAGATLTVAAGAGGSRALNALLDNRGTLTIGIATSVTRAGADHLNSGTLALSGGNLTIVQSGTTPSFTNTGAVTIGAGYALSTSGTGSFVHSAGSITGAGTLALGGATATVTAPLAPAALALTSTTLNLTPGLSTGTVALSLSSSTLNGPGTVTNAADKSVSLVGSTLNAPFVNHGQLHVFGGSTIGGALTTHPGSLIRVNAGIGGTFVTVTPSWTNVGTLELTSNGGGFACSYTQNAGTLTNAPGGVIAILAGTGGARTFNVQLDNQGTFTVGAAASITRASADHVNGGVLEVTGGNLTLTQSGTTPSFVNRGVVTVAAARTLSVSAGAFVNDTTGVLAGSGVYGLSAPVTVTQRGRIAPGASAGLLQISGPCPMEATAALEVELGGVTAGSGHDRLHVTGALTVAGTLEVSVIGGFEPAPGQVFRVLRGASRTGEFASINGLTLPNGLAMEPVYSDTGVALRVVSATWVREIPTGERPAPREGHSAGWDAGSDRMVVFGGRTDAGVANDAWVLARGAAAAWTKLVPAGPPPAARWRHVAGYDSASRTLVVFGGDDGVNQAFGDVWRLSNADGTGGAAAWSAAPAPGGPGALTAAAGAYDSANDRLIVFGGYAGSSCANASNRVWVLSNATAGAAAWTEIAAAGAAPPALHLARAAYDPVANRLIVVNGLEPCDHQSVAAWSLSNANGLGGAAVWTALAPGGVALDTVPLVTVAYEPQSDRLTSFGGYSSAAPNERVVSLTGSRAGNGTWVEHPRRGRGPEPRREASAVMAGTRFVMFGGRSPNGLLNDVWTLLVDEPAIVDVPAEAPAPTPAFTGFARPPAPNPSTGTVSFAFAMTHAGSLELAIHDVGGRRVRVLNQGPLPAGTHTFHWDGRRSEGGAVPAGVYFVRAKGDDHTHVQKVLRLR